MNQVNPTTASGYDQLQRPAAEVKPQGDMGQDDFLTLMTTQLSNQDPFAPMENGEFLGQMAQFGTVSGIKELQASFGSLSSALQSNRALQASVMVGKEVLVVSDTAELSSENGLSGSVALPVGVDNLKVKILDEAGQLVEEINLGSHGAGQADFTWDGKRTQGGEATPGVYYLSAEAVANGQNEAFETLAVANVNSVTMNGAYADLTLNLSGLGEVALSQVRQIR